MTRVLRSLIFYGLSLVSKAVDCSGLQELLQEIVPAVAATADFLTPSFTALQTNKDGIVSESSKTN